ncbi:unnamed protein product [Adineta steineri]|uniref:Uncharacterized protein n=1 Tax=Adineta steineri TaxID=433720 RepID=A0A815RPQ4_9BILA|nr:unnamed protein product [Adineta steineri]CAF1637981.1 unnamed protein product [Adineta steineri]
MHIAFAVFFVLIPYVVSYPSLREVSINDEDNNNDLELELRSILNHLDNEKEERTLTSVEDDSNENENEMIERQGGYNMIKPDLKCEIECVGNMRDPTSDQIKMSIKDATKICKNICTKTNKKREQKISFGQRKEENHEKNLREFTDDDDDENSNSNEKQLRQFSDYLMEQLQLNHKQ